MRSLFGRLLLGKGTLPDAVRSELESEGVLFLGEGLSGSLRYTHFKAPGRRFHGKVTAERFGLGISNERLALYCRSGAGELIDSRFSAPNFGWVSVAVEKRGRLVLTIDYDRSDEDDVSGQIAIHVLTPEAERIAETLRSRLPVGG